MSYEYESIHNANTFILFEYFEGNDNGTNTLLGTYAMAPMRDVNRNPVTEIFSSYL